MGMLWWPLTGQGSSWPSRPGNKTALPPRAGRVVRVQGGAECGLGGSALSTECDRGKGVSPYSEPGHRSRLFLEPYLSLP